MGRRYIVTGGAGFIGSNIVGELNTRGEDDILIVDELGTDEKWRNLVGLRYSDYLHKDDLFPLLAEEYLQNVDVVYHMGACSDTTETDADYLVRNNYEYTKRLFEECLKSGTRFVYASSAATYGDGTLGYSDADTDTPKYRPLNMYGYSKHMFDLWALRNGLIDQIAGLKYFNVYGSGETHKGDMRSVVHKAFGQIESTGQVQLFKSERPEYPDGGQLRDFVYVKDAVAMTLWLGDHPGVNGLFNCGTGKPRSWIDLVSSVFTAMGREPSIEYIDMPEHLRTVYQYRTCADMTKVRARGFDPDFSSVEQGVGEYVSRYLLA